MPYSLLQTLNISRQDILSHLNGLDVTSNNVANINTTGFKANRSNFQELLTKKLKEGTRLVGTQLMPMQGTLTEFDQSARLGDRGRWVF